MRVDYEQLTFRTSQRGRCPVCTGMVDRQRTFMQTLNPFNRNADGTVRTRQEIREALIAEGCTVGPRLPAREVQVMSDFDELADEAERGYDPNLIRQTRPATVRRYRITVRGTGIELRGWVDDPEQVMRLGKVMSIFTEGAGLEPGDPMVVASPASADYDPFRPNRDALLELADAMDADRYPGSDLVRAAADR